MDYLGLAMMKNAPSDDVVSQLSDVDSDIHFSELKTSSKLGRIYDSISKIDIDVHNNAEDDIKRHRIIKEKIVESTTTVVDAVKKLAVDKYRAELYEQIKREVSDEIRKEVYEQASAEARAQALAEIRAEILAEVKHDIESEVAQKVKETVDKQNAEYVTYCKELAARKALALFSAVDMPLSTMSKKQLLTLVQAQIIDRCVLAQLVNKNSGITEALIWMQLSPAITSFADDDKKAAELFEQIFKCGTSNAYAIIRDKMSAILNEKLKQVA